MFFGNIQLLCPGNELFKGKQGNVFQGEYVKVSYLSDLTKLLQFWMVNN
jgi:hypothetical protein